MLFNSFVFVIFAVAFFGVWAFVKPHRVPRFLAVTAFSWLFYAYSTPWWLILLVGTGLIDYFCGLGMERYPGHRRKLLGLSITGNLGLLFYFKYQFFVLNNINRVVDAFGGAAPFDPVQLALPIGISFYTFQSMSYTFGIFKGEMKPTKDILHFLAYLSMWPQLVAGPIERASHLLPQMENPLPVTKDDVWESLNLIVRGFFKKMVIADNLAPAVSAIYDAPSQSQSGALWWVASTMFALQIYGDFSGYTDIARGFARLMGFRLMLNFDHPYGARSVTEFWRKWHISLSSWFRDFVYIPLGGGRRGFWIGIRNMWATMLVSGIWHGAAWTFIIWAALHAFYLTIERLTKWPEKLGARKGGQAASAVIVFGLVVIAWVFFRASGARQGFTIVGAMLNPLQFMPGELASIAPEAYAMLALGLLMVINTAAGWSRRLHERHAWIAGMRPVWIALVAVACLFWRGPGAAFIYFQF